ncbi:helix-turn-helix domain-containing protein [Streptomyces sp. NPDC001832]|uniref:helix-turn-helix domain-containing protein n=1 Tax=Streptomyces sp. NPDC001832 TaxID=3154527 RepID=UPI003328A15B
MQVQRTRHERAFVQIPNQIARHSSLSLEARGLLTYLLSLPSDNGATVEGITSRVPNGRRSVSNAMNELIAAGYVRRSRIQDPETGRWVTITTVSDSPTDHMPTVGAPTGQAVGGYPKGKDPQEKTSSPEPAQQQQPEGCEAGSNEEGEESPQETNPHATAVSALGRLGSVEPRLKLSLSEVTRLAPKAAQWLSDGISEPQMIKALSRALPVSITSAAALVTYRLKNNRPDEEIAPAPMPEPVNASCCQQCEAPFPAGVEMDLCRRCEAEMKRAVARLTGEPVSDPHQEARQATADNAAYVRSFLRK